MSSVFRNRLKIWQDILDTPIVYENVKNGYREFDRSSTLKRVRLSWESSQFKAIVVML